jgi:hypothetical protein
MSINEFMFILSYSCQNVYFYYLKCNDECCLVNMLCLKKRTFRFYKPNVPVLVVLPGKIGWFGLPNRTV